MANDYVDDCMFAPASGGTGNFVFSAAVSGYRSPVGLLVDGAIYEYRAQSADLSQWENGSGAWTAATNTVARTTITASSNAGAAVNFSNPPQVGLTILSASIKSLVRVDQAQSFTATQQDQARANIAANYHGRLHRLTLSTAGSSSTFSVADGEALSDDFTTLMTLAASINKTTGAWAVGTGNGSLDTGTVAINTWYHAFIIERPDTGVVDVLTSLSATAPTLPTNYTKKRRIGSMKTNASSQWTLFHQVGDEFLWDVRSGDVAGIASTATSVLTTISVPTGVQVRAEFSLRVDYSTVANAVLVTSPDESDQTATTQIQTVTASATATTATAALIVRTNASAQVRLKSSGAGCTIYITTYGWLDDRGKSV